MGLAAALFFARRYGIWFGIVSGYCLISAIYAALWRWNHFAHFPALKLIALQRAILVGTFSTLLTWLIISTSTIPRQTFARLFVALGFVFCFHYWFLRGRYAPDGFLMTPTLMSIYLIFLIPLVAAEKWWLHLAYLVPTIAWIRGDTALASLAALIAGYFFIHFPRRTGAIVSVGIFGGIAWLARHGLEDQGRFKMWGHVWTHFWESPHRAFGFGAGTAYQLIPWLQQELGLDPSGSGGMFTYLHNEYLQGLFELGIVGMALVIGLGWLAAYRAFRRKDAHGFAFLCALVPASFGFFPFRHDTIALLVAFHLHPLFLPRPAPYARLT